MLTENFIQRLNFKALWRLCFYVLATVVLFLLVINITLLFSKNKIAQIVNMYFPTRVTVMHVYCVWPNEIVLKNVFISNNNETQDHTFLFPRMVIRFRLFESLKNKSAVIREVLVGRPRVNLPRFTRYIQEHALEIKIIIDSLPKNDLAIKVYKARVNLANERDNPDVLDTDIKLVIEPPQIKLDARFLKESAAGRKTPLVLTFEGDAQPNEFFIRKIDLKGQHINSNLWGILQGNILEVNGFLIFDFFAKEMPKERKLTYKTERHPSSSDPGQSVYLLDLKTRMAFVPPALKISLLKFNANNKPVSITGEFDFADNIGFHIQAQHVNDHPAKKEVNLTRADFSADGRWTYRQLVFDSSLMFEYDEKRAGQSRASYVRSNFQDVSLGISPEDCMVLGVTSSRVEYDNGDVRQVLDLKDLGAAYNQAEDDLDIVDLQAPFYGGRLTGKVWIDSKTYPAKFTTVLWVKSAEANQLKDFYPYFDKIHGLLDSKIHIQSEPKMDVLGELSITNGRLVQFEFFEWLADRFRLASLLDLHFDKAFSEFYLNYDGTGLKNISLNASGVSLTGNYEVNRNNLVSSKIALAFSKNLLKESPKFTPLLKLFPDDSLKFDFQMSGNQNAMNFQWLASDVKQKIQDRIPDFIERHIERRIDAELDVKPAEVPPPAKPPQSNISVEPAPPKVPAETDMKGAQ